MTNKTGNATCAREQDEADALHATRRDARDAGSLDVAKESVVHALGQETKREG